MNVGDMLKNAKVPGTLPVLVLLGVSYLIQANVDHNAAIYQVLVLVVAALLKTAQEKAGVTVEIKEIDKDAANAVIAHPAAAPAARGMGTVVEPDSVTAAPMVARGRIERILLG